MKKNLFPTILIGVLLALWGLVLFGYNYSQAAIIGKSSSNNSLKRGLVGWWTFDGPYVTVNTTTDSSGQGNDGTRQGVVKNILGKIGQAMFFDGAVGDYVSMPTPNVNTTTIAFWYKTNTTTLPNGHRVFISGSGNASGQTYISLSNIGGTAVPFVSMRISSTQQTLSSLVDSQIGKWTHVIVTWNGQFIRIYVNGILRNTSADLTTGNLSGYDGGIGDIGRYQAATGYEFFGSIDDVRFYNRALSPAEIVQLYTMGGNKINRTDAARAALRNGLIGHWTFDGSEVTTNTTTDRSLNKNDGTRNATGTLPVFGKIGQAMKFDGKNGNVDILDQSYFSPPNNPMTITGWFKTIATARSTIVAKSTANQYEWAVEINGDAANKLNWQLWQSSGAGYGVVDSSIVVNNGKWHYFAATINYGVRQELFVDGVSQGSNTSFTNTMTDLAANVEIGRRPDGANSLNGTVDDVRIYNRILSPAEVVELYKNGGGKINKTDTTRLDLKRGLLGHWTFDGPDMTANTSTDKSGNGNDGVNTNVIGGIGKIGQGVVFDDTFRIIKISTSSSLGVLGNNGTISFWVKPKPTIVPNDTYVSYGNAAQYASGIALYRTSNTQLGAYWLSAGPSVTLANAFDYNKWQLFTLTNSGGALTLYKNGIVAGTGTSGGAITNATFKYYIGDEDDSGWVANGSMDDVRIYSRALAQAEVMELYRMGR